MTVRLDAAEGLALVSSPGGSWRVEWGEPDWLGPVRARIAHRGAIATELRAGEPSRGCDELGEFGGPRRALEAHGRVLLSMSETLERKTAKLRAQEVPFAAVELDSWFYPHQVLRELYPGAQTEVPPGRFELTLAIPDRGDVRVALG